MERVVFCLMGHRLLPPRAPLGQDVLPSRAFGPFQSGLRPLLRLNPQKTLSAYSGETSSVHRLVVRMAAFQAVDMGSNPVERM